MLMRDEFTSLKIIGQFLGHLSIGDVQGLAARKTDHTFVAFAHRLRLRQSLMAMAPHVAPEKLDMVLDQLTPEQIRSIDSGRIQIGSVIDMSELFAAGPLAAAATTSLPTSTGNDEGDMADTDVLPHLNSLETHPHLDKALSASRDLEETVQNATAPGSSETWAPTKHSIKQKLDEITHRLDRVQQILASE